MLEHAFQHAFLQGERTIDGVVHVQVSNANDFDGSSGLDLELASECHDVDAHSKDILPNEALQTIQTCNAQQTTEQAPFRGGVSWEIPMGAKVNIMSNTYDVSMAAHHPPVESVASPNQ